MNLGCLWICLVGITPSNNPDTERELLPYMVGNSLALPNMVMGNPTGHGIQFQGMGILFNYLCQRSAFVLQSIRPSDLYEQLAFSLYLNGAWSLVILKSYHGDVKTISCL